MKSLYDLLRSIVKNNFIIHSLIIVMFVIVAAISFYFSFVGCNIDVGYNLANDIINGLPDPGNPNPPGETRSTFRIHHIYMKSAPSLCSYKGLPAYYDGYAAIKNAFANCNTTISIKGVDTTGDILTIATDLDLMNWQINTLTAAGIYNNGHPNRDISILFGCIDVSTIICAPDALGFENDRTSSYPASSFILSARITAVAERDYPSSPEYWANVCLSNVVCHELGHTREIQGDDNLAGGLIPPHSGNNTTVCAMHTATAASQYNTSPIFCDGHRDFIKTITW